jgi:hypothetical protein
MKQVRNKVVCDWKVDTKRVGVSDFLTLTEVGRATNLLGRTERLRERVNPNPVPSCITPRELES